MLKRSNININIVFLDKRVHSSPGSLVHSPLFHVPDVLDLGQLVHQVEEGGLIEEASFKAKHFQLLTGINFQEIFDEAIALDDPVVEEDAAQFLQAWTPKHKVL